MSTVISAIIPLIIRIILILIGAFILWLIPKIASYVKTKVGSGKLAHALAVAEKVYQQIITYIQTNPAAEKTLEALYAQFRAGILQVLPLNDAEIDFLFKGIIGDLIKALGLTATDFATAFSVEYTSKPKLLFK